MNEVIGESRIQKMQLGFQVAKVKKPLIPVKRINEAGNDVHFGAGNLALRQSFRHFIHWTC